MPKWRLIHERNSRLPNWLVITMITIPWSSLYLSIGGSINGACAAKEEKSSPKIDVAGLMIDERAQKELDSILSRADPTCGRVPLYERATGKSIPPASQEALAGSRVSYGQDAVTDEWPWLVRLSICDSVECSSFGYCTGTLLDKRWIISAGHCAYQKRAVEVNASIGLYDIVTPEKSSTTVQIDKIIMHPEYNNLNNDLALFRLVRPVEYSDHIQPACLVGRTRDLIKYTEGRLCYLIGYGLTEGMNEATRLQKLEIVMKKLSECNSNQLSSVELRRTTVCVVPPSRKPGAGCKGDSGGPNICYDSVNNRWELVATVSYGPANCDRDMEDTWSTMSVDLSEFRTWILATIRMYSSM